MANYETLKTAIQNVVKTNGNNEITGALLQQSLISMVNSLGAYFQFMGLATPATNPGTPDQNVFYIGGPGTYPNFNSTVVGDGNMAVFLYNGSWSVETTPIGDFTAINERIDDLIAELSETAYVDITHNGDGVITGKAISPTGTIFNLSGRNIYYKLFNEETTVRYSTIIASNGAMMYCDGTVGNPTNKVMVVTAAGSGTFTVPAGKRLYWVDYENGGGTTVEVETVGQLKDFATKPDILAETDPIIEQIKRDREMAQIANKYGSIMADWMQLVHSVSGMSSIAVYDVVSVSGNSITLSSADASHFTNDGPVVVRYSNGDCKVVYFGPANGSVITKLTFDTTSLSGAVQVQSLHDTVRGGGGIHLSQLGYIAMGQFTAAQVLAKLSQKDANLLHSIQFYNSTVSSDKKTIIDQFGLSVASVETNMSSSGFTPNGNGLLNSYGIITGQQYNSDTFGFLYNAYRVQQGEANKYIQFNFNVIGTGFVEIQAGLSLRKATSTGTATLRLYVDGELFYTKQMVHCQERFQIPDVNASKNIAVRFTIDGNVDTEIAIYSINFWSMSTRVPVVGSLSGKKVAFLGDSWTQFPGSANALPEYSSYNTVVTRPDGTTGDGLGYFPKEFARVTGATVDNWGKSNMRADNWGLVKIDQLLAHDTYDYVFIEFFINDYNAGISTEEWAANIAKIAQKCKSAGARPIIAVPCMVNSATVNPYGIRHEFAMRGFSLL